jgi:hypothetical protein
MRIRRCRGRPPGEGREQLTALAMAARADMRATGSGHRLVKPVLPTLLHHRQMLPSASGPLHPET